MKFSAALLSAALLALLALAAAQAPVPLAGESSAASVPAPAQDAMQVAPILAEASEASTRLVADRGVSTRKNRGGGKVTLISNKNLLTHIASAPKQVNHFELEEEDKKSQVEQDTKAAAMKERQRAQEAHEKKVAAEEQAAKNALEEKAKKEKAEQAEKAQAEENSKAQARLTAEKAKADEALAKAKKKAEESSLEESSDEDDGKRRKKKKDDDDDDGEGGGGGRRRRRRHRGRGRRHRGRGRRHRGRRRSAALTMVGYSPYGEPYSPARVESAGGLCVVRGLVNRQSSDHIATLPSHCYPRDGRLIFNLFHNADVRVDVLPDGRIFYVAGSIAASWLSLNGITFAPSATQGVQMYNNWQPYGSGYRNTVQSKHGKLCVLSGLIRSGGWGALAQMRGDCNPTGGRLIFSCNNHGSVTRVDVTDGGTVVYSGGSANYGWVSLDGIIYTPNQGGDEIGLQSGWGNYYNSYRTARYERTGSWCALSGLIRGSWGSLIGQLPKKCRPIKRLIFNANVHEWSARVDVLPTGEVYYISRNGNYGWMSLSNIHFAVRK